MKVRIRFKKYGVMKYIGHLDTMRYFQKAIRRSEIPIHYSGGFSAHQIMSFAFPLGVGIIGEREYMDIEMDEGLTSDEIVNRLNAQMVEGVEVLDAVRLDDKAINAMASVKAADYTITLKDGGCFPESINTDSVSAFLSRDTIPYVKVTSKNETEIDLKEHIYDLSFRDGSLYMRVDASSAGNLKPVTLLEELFKFTDDEFDECIYLITRNELYMQDEEGRLQSLLSAGIRI